MIIYGNIKHLPVSYSGILTTITIVKDYDFRFTSGSRYQWVVYMHFDLIVFHMYMYMHKVTSDNSPF